MSHFIWSSPLSWTIFCLLDILESYSSYEIFIKHHLFRYSHTIIVRKHTFLIFPRSAQITHYWRHRHFKCRLTTLAYHFVISRLSQLVFVCWLYNRFGSRFTIHLTLSEFSPRCEWPENCGQLLCHGLKVCLLTYASGTSLISNTAPETIIISVIIIITSKICLFVYVMKTVM